MTELSRKRKRYFELSEPSNSSTEEQGCPGIRAYLRINLKEHRQSFSEDDFEGTKFDGIQPESKPLHVGKWISFTDGKKIRKLELQDTLTARPMVPLPSQKRFAASAHPLENHLILNTIFQYLGVEDMKSCRLVCSQWEEEIRPLFKSKAVVEIDMVCPQSGRHPTDFLQNMSDNRSQESQFPSHHLRISGIDMKNVNLGRVLDICGPELRSLSLDFVPSFVEETAHTLDFKHFLKFSLLFPALETLELFNMPDHLISKGFPKLMKAVMENSSFKTLTSFVFCSTGYFCPLDAAFIMDFMDVCPNLSKLSFSVGDDDALDEILTALEFRGHYMDRLESLKFGSGFGNTLYETHIQTLINANLCSLAHLEINSLGVDISDETLEWLMRNLSPVLKFLKLGPLVQISLNVVTMLNLRFPLVMKNLKHLEIYDVGILQVGPIVSILPKLPKLKTLIFNRCTRLANNPRNDIFPSNVGDKCDPHLQLRELTLPQSQVDMDDFLAVKLLFPRLINLSLFD